jgi:hypothetical protein
VRLFKYVSSMSAILNMARGLLKFTPIPDLNDPSELTPVMDRDAVRASLTRLRQQGLSEDQFLWLHRQGKTLDLLAPEEKVLNAPSSREQANRMLSIAAYDDLGYMERKLFATIGSIRSKVGVLSLSARHDSLPMWAHYANLAKGYVAVFEGLEKSFPGDDTGSLNVPKPVEYTERFLGMTFDPSTQDRIFFSKLSDWSYEREWRVVTALSDCEQTEGPLYLRAIDPRHLTGVICGWRVEADERAALEQRLAHLDARCRIMSACLDSGAVNLVPPMSGS